MILMIGIITDRARIIVHVGLDFSKGVTLTAQCWYLFIVRIKREL
jgi:hypothetical protein